MKVWTATVAAVVAVVAVVAVFCGACPPATTAAAANCHHGISFKIAEKPSISDINRFEKFYSIIIIFF